jgi:peptidyl-prolyl cis-trans isomerase C
VLDRKKYDIPEQVDAWHILFMPAKHGGSDGALAAAKGARAKLVAGADFATLAKEVSDDPSAKNNSGHLSYFPRGATDKDFEAAAFGVTKFGEISEPVKSQFGWHIIRVDGRKAARERPFDEVKSGIMAEQREKAIRDAREAAVQAVRSDPKLVVNQEAVESLVTTVEVPKELLAPVAAPAK